MPFRASPDTGNFMVSGICVREAGDITKKGEEEFSIEAAALWLGELTKPVRAKGLSPIPN